jgi:alpha-ketoglutaric semialdehyde dehydrogenase
MERHGVLRKAADEITARKEELGKLLAREEGKTLAEGIGETVRAAQIFDFFAGEALRLSGETVPSVRPGVGVEMTREAVGVVGIITPWNFPIAIPAWKIAPALCYGNTVVFKPADLTPGCAWAIVDILHRAGLPKGVLNLVMGKGSVVGQAMLDSKDVDAISFTGSVGTGRRVAAASVEKDAQVPARDGRQEPAGRARRCRSRHRRRLRRQWRLLLHRPALHRVLAPDRDRRHPRPLRRGRHREAEEPFVDNAIKQGTHIGPVVDEGQLEQDEKYIAIGRDEGAKLHWGGERLNRETPGFYLQPALFTEATNEMRISREEIFGPVASVIRVKDYDEALHVANDTEFGLSSGICTTSLKHATHFKRNAEAGMVMVNLPTAGVDFHVPFGGRKGSATARANRAATPPSSTRRSRPPTRWPILGWR